MGLVRAGVPCGPPGSSPMLCDALLPSVLLRCLLVPGAPVLHTSRGHGVSGWEHLLRPRRALASGGGCGEARR